jgi:hypothetical protein
MDLKKYLDINNFVNNSAFNDAGVNDAGLLRLNRFIGVLHAKDFSNLSTVFGGTKAFNRSEYLTWNIMKIDVPEFKIGIETKEVDAIPRYYFKTWEYSDLSISFLESSDLDMKHYFFSWMTYALNAKTFVRRYYDDVKADQFIIYPIDNDGGNSMIEIFYEVVPFSVSSFNYDVTDEGNSVALTTVKFKYIGHEVLKNTQN